MIEQSLEVYEKMGDKRRSAMCLAKLGDLAYAQGLRHLGITRLPAAFCARALEQPHPLASNIEILVAGRQRWLGRQETVRLLQFIADCRVFLALPPLSPHEPAPQTCPTPGL